MARRQNEWVRRRWQTLIDEFGGQCDTCFNLFDLEFAHIKPTECHGRGRGKSRRLLDVLKNPSHYRLLCMDCHDEFDGRAKRRRQVDYIRLAGVS